MYLLRDAASDDLDALVELSQALDTLNLPHDPKALSQLLELSSDSFSGKIQNPLERTYLFVLEDPESGNIIGTSQIIAQHGTLKAPHVFLEVYEREHYSSMLDKHFRHTVMRIGYNYEGHTEIGGLVVHPEERRKGRPGKQLSFVRFLFVAMHRELFRERIIAELLPPLQPDGKSILWEALGARFTGLSYQEADKLSRISKEFIQQLFPQGEIYVELLPQDVQEVIGQVGPGTEPVKHMLESIGFEYDSQIDPFDGGPHFSAALEDISPIAGYRTGTVAERILALEPETERDSKGSIPSKPTSQAPSTFAAPGSSERRRSETRSSESRNSESRSSESRSSETRSSEARDSETRSSETRSSETRSSETRSSETRGSETGSLETRGLETRGLESLSTADSEATGAPEWRLVAASRASGQTEWSGNTGAQRSPGSFRALLSLCRWEGKELEIPEKARKLLQLKAGDEVHTIPFDL